MSRAVRTALFLFFVAVFVVAAPAVVLYTAGYRLNTTTGQVLQAGVIAMSTQPRGADITLNQAAVEQRTPFVAQRLLAGSYHVTLSKDGYYPWTETVTVESGKTTYVEALLFAKHSPALILNTQLLSASPSPDGDTVAFAVASGVAGHHDIWLFNLSTLLEERLGSVPVTNGDVFELAWSTTSDAVVALVDQDPSLREGRGEPVAGWQTNGTALSLAEREQALDPVPNISLLPSDDGVRVTQKTLTGAVERLATIPGGIYKKVLHDEATLVLKNTNDEVFIINTERKTVIDTNTVATLVSWNEDTRELVVSDGHEVTILTEYGRRILLTRQSQPVVGLGWHPSGLVVYVASTQNIVALDRQSHEERHVTTLASDITLESFWANAEGKNIYFLGTVDALRGIYSIKLTK